ncbi:hypothetical protein PARU111607_14170 [Palleronia rufa]
MPSTPHIRLTIARQAIWRRQIRREGGQICRCFATKTSVVPPPARGRRSTIVPDRWRKTVSPLSRMLRSALSVADSFFRAAISASSARCCPLGRKAVAGVEAASRIQRRSALSARSRSPARLRNRNTPLGHQLDRLDSEPAELPSGRTLPGHGFIAMSTGSAAGQGGKRGRCRRWRRSTSRICRSGPAPGSHCNRSRPRPAGRSCSPSPDGRPKRPLRVAGPTARRLHVEPASADCFHRRAETRHVFAPPSGHAVRTFSVELILCQSGGLRRIESPFCAIFKPH